MQVVSLRGDSWKPEQGGERVREGSQGGVCFPAAASGGCYSVLLGDSAGVRRLGRCDPPAPCRARSAASMALRPSLAREPVAPVVPEQEGLKGRPKGQSLGR